MCISHNDDAYFSVILVLKLFDFRHSDRFLKSMSGSEWVGQKYRPKYKKMGNEWISFAELILLTQRLVIVTSYRPISSSSVWNLLYLFRWSERTDPFT